MQHEILYKPSYSLLELSLNKGEEINTESGAMVSHSEGVEISTQKGGDGFLDSVKRSVSGDESFFVNTFKANQPGHVTLAPPLPGDIISISMRNEIILAQSGSYVAGSPNLSLDTRFGGAKTFFSGEGLSLLEIEGSGILFLSSYGAVHEVELGRGERYTVDTDHIVAFQDSVDFSVSKVGDVKSTMLSGEGIVSKFEGPGKLWIQSRNPQAFMSWVVSNMPKQLLSKDTALDMLK